MLMGYTGGLDFTEYHQPTSWNIMRFNGDLMEYNQQTRIKSSSSCCVCVRAHTSPVQLQATAPKAFL